MRNSKSENPVRVFTGDEERRAIMAAPPMWELVRRDGGDPVRLQTCVASEEWYQLLDPGIRFAVRVLHAAGIDTVQSCAGGEEHSYPVPTVDLAPEEGAGFAALGALMSYGLHVASVAIVWRIEDGMPVERCWRVELRKPHPDRADERPGFVRGVLPFAE